MLPEHKKTLKSLVLTLRHLFEGRYDESGAWHPGDLERRLNALGVFADREVPMHDMGQLSDADRRARDVADAYIALRDSSGIARESAVREHVRESAHTWANRLLALRMMEARGLIDEVVLARADYGSRSLEHHRALQADSSLRTHEDEGLAVVLEDVFARMSDRLPNLFEPTSPATALRPSTTALKKAIALLSGTEAPRGQQPATGDVFTAADALGWAYQYWNTEEKDRVFEAVRTKKAKISGDDIIPATQLYTEPYMVKFLVQNSLGATWMCMHPESKLVEGWEYYVKDADREPMDPRPASELTFLDPACGSGHFLLEAFDMLFDCYEEEGERDASAIATSILERNLFGIDIDERAVQIAEAALWMRAAERVPGFAGLPPNLLATNIRLPEEKAGVDAYLTEHPEDAPLKPALEAVLSSLQHADELGSLLKLEEPIDEELKRLERAFERSSARGTQAALFGETGIQGQLPVGVSSYDEWKRKVVSRLAEHFHEEAVSADAGAAWFGRSAGKGLKLFELLSRRYDVVAANPPYMGSGNMGSALKRYVDSYYDDGKADLSAAMLLRAVDLVVAAGRVAVVSQQAWLFQRKYVRCRTGGELSVFDTCSVESVAHLGENAFVEPSAAGAFVAAFTASKSPPAVNTTLTAFRLVGLGTPREKAQALRDGASGKSTLNRYAARQQMLARIEEAPCVYWLPESILLALADPAVARVRDIAEATQGLATTDNQHFLRARWEVADRADRWFPYQKGGGYGRWWRDSEWYVDWRNAGSAIKDSVRTKYPYLNGNVEWVTKRDEVYFVPGWTWSDFGRGSLGMRPLVEPGLYDKLSPALVHPTQALDPVAASLNAFVYSYIMRALTPNPQHLSEGYVARLPVISDSGLLSLVDEAGRCCVALRRVGSASSRYGDGLPEGFFAGNPLTIAAAHAITAAAEASIERLVAEGLSLSTDDMEDVYRETGKPVGLYPLLSSHSETPDYSDGAIGQSPAHAALEGSEAVEVSAGDLYGLRQKLAGLYERGPGRRHEDSNSQDETQAAEQNAAGAFIPIPPETFIEELSQKLEIHPISVYWLLKEGIEQEGWRCIPEEQRELTDKVTVLVLRALGHRWPKDIEAGAPIAPYADPDGVIPISEEADESALIERLRGVVEEETGTHAGEFEAHFADAMGVSLETWLATKFFAHHVKQFKKRPIAWHLVSSKPTARRQPAFSALVYYHALDADLIPKIRSHYLSPMRSRAETQLRGIEATPEAARSAGQAARRVELDERIAELKDLDERLEAIEREGFESPELTKLVAKESVDAFCSIDGVKPKPVDTQAFVIQEQAYLPDLNDGVRVNIAPWQKGGVLAADVLATKDLDKAIADRARWRSDERCWCREGKLPRPGWWPEA